MVKPYDDVYLDDITFCVSLKNIAKTVSKFKDVSDLVHLDYILTLTTSLTLTSTGLILRNIMKTSHDSYTITIKQIVRFQESFIL